MDGCIVPALVSLTHNTTQPKKMTAALARTRSPRPRHHALRTPAVARALPVLCARAGARSRPLLASSLLGLLKQPTMWRPRLTRSPLALPLLPTPLLFPPGVSAGNKLSQLELEARGHVRGLSFRHKVTSRTSCHPPQHCHNVFLILCVLHTHKWPRQKHLIRASTTSPQYHPLPQHVHTCTHHHTYPEHHVHA